MKYDNMDGGAGSHSKKRATGGHSGMNKASYSDGKGAVTKSAVAGKSVTSRPGNPHTGMGVKAGSSPESRMADVGNTSEAGWGHSRMRKGKNTTGAGPQGFRG